MPKGPGEEKRPADVIGAAILVANLVAKIATGEVEDTQRDPAKDANRKGGLKGGDVLAHYASSAAEGCGCGADADS